MDENPYCIFMLGTYKLIFWLVALSSEDGWESLMVPLGARKKSCCGQKKR